MGKAYSGNPTKYIGVDYRRLGSGSDLVLRCTRITVRPSSATTNAAMSTIQSNVELKRQITILWRLVRRSLHSIGSGE
jgi:hypothetical protein